MPPKSTACCVVIIIELICIACLLFCIFIYNRYTLKIRGGRALIDSTKGTVIKFPHDSDLFVYHSPIVIRRAAEQPLLDVKVLCDKINKFDGFAHIIRIAVIEACQILGNSEMPTQIYDALCDCNMYTNALFTRDDGVCDMDGILRILTGENDANMNRLISIRESLIDTMKMGNNNNYIVDAMIEVSQGDVKRINEKSKTITIYMYGNTCRKPNTDYSPLIDDFMLEQTTKVDTFAKEIFDTSMLRRWYNTNEFRRNRKNAYKEMNMQYMRLDNRPIQCDSADQTTAKIQHLKKVDPDMGVSKGKDDTIADIIPAISVRQSIMFYLDHILSPLPSDNTKLIIDVVRKKYSNEKKYTDNVISAHISYITLLCGLANAFGNTAHYSKYNSAIGDNYRYEAQRLVPEGVTDIIKV